MEKIFCGKIKQMLAKKSLGQHFLTSKKIVSEMVEAGNVNKDDLVLEIGPGKGILTEKLLKSAKQIIAIEKDTVLVNYLNKKFKNEVKMGKLKLIEGDVLGYQPPKNQEYKLIANIPYYITGAIIEKFFSAIKQPKTIALLVQKEVAERIIAKKGSILSISVGVYGKPRLVKIVEANNFSPPPKVDSAILVIDEISKNFFKGINEQKFFEIIKIGFAHKRKLLIRNLENLKINRVNLIEIFKELRLSEKSRAEDLSSKDWLHLAKKIV